MQRWRGSVAPGPLHVSKMLGKPMIRARVAAASSCARDPTAWSKYEARGMALHDSSAQICDAYCRCAIHVGCLLCGQPAASCGGAHRQGEHGRGSPPCRPGRQQGAPAGVLRRRGRGAPPPLPWSCCRGHTRRPSAGTILGPIAGSTQGSLPQGPYDFLLKRAYDSLQKRAYDSLQMRAYDSLQMRAYDSLPKRAVGSIRFPTEESSGDIISLLQGAYCTEKLTEVDSKILS